MRGGSIRSRDPHYRLCREKLNFPAAAALAHDESDDPDPAHAAATDEPRRVYPRAERVEHPAVMTVEESERLVPLPGAKTKNLFLRDKKRLHLR
jgi:hypothetical protein